MRVENPEVMGDGDERIAGLIAAEVSGAMLRHPNEAFAAEARRRLAVGQAMPPGSPIVRFAQHLALPLAAALLVGVSIATFLERAPRFRPFAPTTFGQQLAALEPERPVRSSALPPDATALTDELQRMMKATAAANHRASPKPAASPDGGGVSEMLRSGAVYRFLQNHATITQEG
jgi:hypothetical protein